MIVRPIKTDRISAGQYTITEVLDKFLGSLQESSVVVISSKIVALCENRVEPSITDPDELWHRESDYYLPAEASKYHHHFSIVNHTLVGRGGIDQSNAGGNFVLWPRDPQASANQIRAYLRQKFGLKSLGVIISDSISVPMRLGAISTAIAYSGFMPIRSYIGERDLFGREFLVERASLISGLAAAAGLVMGEGAEQTPIAVIEKPENIEFCEADPSETELAEQRLDLDTDLFEVFFKNAPWQEGRNKR